jgi:hypothetical protein
MKIHWRRSIDDVHDIIFRIVCAFAALGPAPFAIIISRAEVIPTMTAATFYWFVSHNFALPILMIHYLGNLSSPLVPKTPQHAPFNPFEIIV